MLQFVDAAGRIAASRYIETGSAELTMDFLCPGVYLLRLGAADSRAVDKLVVR